MPLASLTIATFVVYTLVVALTATNTYTSNIQEPTNASKPIQAESVSLKETGTHVNVNDSSVSEKNRLVSGFQCSSFVIWHDLGNQSFPQFLREEVCGQERCFGGLFRCKPVYYTMSVLTKRKSRGLPEDASLPGALRDNWRFEHVNVSIGCTCGM